MIYIDLRINNNIYHLWRLWLQAAKELAKDLNMKYRIYKRKRLQSTNEIMYWLEKPEIEVFEIYYEKNLFTEINNGKY